LLLVGIDERYSIPILSGLGLSDVSKLENFTLAVREPSVAMCVSLRGLLLSPKLRTLQKLHLGACRFSREPFDQISQGICGSTNAFTISFDNCKFDLESTCLFEQAFQSRTSRTVDRLAICVDYTRFRKPIGTVLTNILGPSSLLKTLNLRMNYEVADITAILQAVARSPNLEGLLMHHVDSEENCQALAAGLATVSRLRQFHFGLAASLYGNVAVKRRFRRAFRHNTSIEDNLYVGYGRVYWNGPELAAFLCRSGRAYCRVCVGVSANPVFCCAFWQGSVSTSGRHHKTEANRRLCKIQDNHTGVPENPCFYCSAGRKNCSCCSVTLRSRGSTQQRRPVRSPI
jgi:hypothetical protein